MPVQRHHAQALQRLKPGTERRKLAPRQELQHAIASLGMDEVKDVRMGKYVEMKIASDDRAEAERITAEACRKLLANPVMENFHYTLEKV